MRVDSSASDFVLVSLCKSSANPERTCDQERDLRLGGKMKNLSFRGQGLPKGFGHVWKQLCWFKGVLKEGKVFFFSLSFV